MRNYREARTEDEKSDSRLTGPEASRCWECALKTNIRFEGKGAFLLAFLFREACPGKMPMALVPNPCPERRTTRPSYVLGLALVPNPCPERRTTCPSYVLGFDPPHSIISEKFRA